MDPANHRLLERRRSRDGRTGTIRRSDRDRGLKSGHRCGIDGSSAFDRRLVADARQIITTVLS
ncbi:hypothetical protein EA472_15015 [Natrarchaeobius oligotrophus]|uniref:Uncharacterized protein n=1 Tax=Natrarchaeobius chitinivorans TaxID=1679083 RepID=A0A3N6PG47_NATCH|nr:hypothetical protein EA472_15015 [Natrarchaeobius chitinivorans]